jgi:hypothetical protein
MSAASLLFAKRPLGRRVGLAFWAPDQESDKAFRCFRFPGLKPCFRTQSNDISPVEVQINGLREKQ